ncbi:Ankrd7 [Symbiodinium sp. CCMP2456]|nr:Ankrd7 [Symbiodinium sp. CCMP2456]
MTVMPRASMTRHFWSTILRVFPALFAQGASQSLRTLRSSGDIFQNATLTDSGDGENNSWPPLWVVLVAGGVLTLLISVVGVSLTIWLNSRETPEYMQVPADTEELMQSLQEVQEVNKVRNKFDFRMQQRLKWLLGSRAAGQLTTIAHSRLSSDVKLAFELVVMVGILYYVDLTLDIQACITFWETGNPKFFMTNVMAMLAASAYTAYHVFTHGDMLLSDLSRNEVFMLGISYVFQLHVIYLCWISWKRGKKHQLLIDSKFAEAAIEAVVSSLVQTYAVVFGARTLSHYQQLTLYLSILGSLASISNAFTLFDSPSGIDQAPGNETSPISPRLLLVNGFRLCELTNKITGLSLFQLAFRPYGGCFAAAASYLAMTASIWFFGGQASFALPCVFALINPLLETHNAVTMPHMVYYSLRLIETTIMILLVWFVADVDVHLIYQHCIPAVLAFAASGVGMMALLPAVRCCASAGLINQNVYTTAEWARKPFSAAQCKLRAATLKGKDYQEATAVMLLPAWHVMDVAHNINRTNLDAFMELVNEPPILQSLSPPPPAFMYKALHVLGNTPLEADQKLRHGLVTFALQALLDHPTLMARIFMETKALDAIASLILAECSITRVGLQVELPREICQLFLSACSTLLRQNDTAALRRLQTSQLARALAAVSLEQYMEPQLQKELVLALAGLYRPENLQRSDLRLRLVVSGAVEHGSLEILCAVPRLFDALSADPVVRTCFQVSAGYLVPYFCQMLNRLDAAKAEQASLAQAEYQPLLQSSSPDPTASGEDVLNTSIESLLQCLLLAAQHLHAEDVSSCSSDLQRFVQQALKSAEETRTSTAKKVQLLVGAKGLLRQLEAAEAAAADGSVDWSGTPPGLEKPLLQVAIESGSLAAVNFLLSKRADATQRSSTGHSAFHVALSVGDTDILEALESSMGTPSLPDGVLFAGGSNAGSDLASYTTSDVASSEAGAVSVRLGLWTRARGPPFHLRLRHGQLVATLVTGEEVWSCEAKVQIGSTVELRWSSWEAAQDRWAQGKEGPLRMIVKVQSKDALLIMGEEMAYFSHWNSVGYEDQVLFDGVSVLFDGQGDHTRRGRLDYVNVYGRQAVTDGQQYYEFKVRRVVCNLYLGLIVPEAVQVKDGSHDYGGGQFDRWCVRLKPQYKKNEVMLGSKTVKIKAPLQPHSNTIGMLVDMTKRAVLFSLNGELLHDPVCDLPETLYLMATLDTEGDHFEVSQPSPPPKTVEALKKLSACGEVQSWMCDDCLCTYSRIDNTSQVQRWTCRRSGGNLCEGCRLGVGTLPNGYCGLSLSAWRDSGVTAIDEDDASLRGFRLMMSKKMCWSRGQLIESLFLATLANHGNCVLELLMKMRENLHASVPITFVGRFNLPSLLTKPSVEKIARMALSVGIFAARPWAVDAALVFLKSFKEQEEGQEEGLDKSRTKSSASVISVPSGDSHYDDIARSQAAPLREPWFQHLHLPSLLCALQSYCATGRQLQKHANALYPVSETENGCSTCPRHPAEYACDTGDFFQCHQCFHLSERPAPAQQEDCSAVIARLLEEDPSSLDVRLSTDLRMAPRVGDLMLAREAGQRDFMSDPVYRVEKDQRGQLQLVHLGAASLAHSQDDGDTDPLEVGPVMTDWESESAASSDVSYDSDEEEDGCPSIDKAEPLWFLSSGSTALHLAAALPSSRFLKQLLDAYSETDAGPAADVTQTIPKSDTSWVKDVRKQIESWGLSESQTHQRVFVFDAQNQMVRWPPDRSPMPQSRFPLTLVCSGDHWLSRRSDHGQTAVHIAAVANNTAQLQLLLDAHADATAQDNNGLTPLMLALKIRGEDAAFRLITHTEQNRPVAINSADVSFCTALHFAVFAGHMAATVVKRLLEARANPMPKNKDGHTPLMLAIQQGSAAAGVVEAFLSPGSWSPEVSQKLDDKDKSGRSALMMVVERKLEDQAKLLLEAGAKLDEEDKDGRTPLEMVQSEGMIKILCGRSSPPLRSARGGSVLKWLLDARHGQVLAQALRQSVPLSRLVEAGQNSSSLPEMEILLHWTAEDAKTLSEEDREARFQEVLRGISDQNILSEVLRCTTERESSYISVATFLVKHGARARDAIGLAIRHKRVALVSQLLHVSQITLEAESNEAKGGLAGLELLCEVLESAEGEVQQMEPDLSAKEILLVLGKVAYGAEQWAKVDTKVKTIHPVQQPAEYKKLVLKGFQDIAARKKEQQEAQAKQAKKQQQAAEQAAQRARLDSNLEEMLDECSEYGDDFSDGSCTVTQAATGADVAGAVTDG